MLQNKYIKKNECVPHAYTKSIHSLVWKAICTVWLNVIEGLGWSLKNKSKIIFWLDSLLDKFGPLYEHSMQDISNYSKNYIVAKFVTIGN